MDDAYWFRAWGPPGRPGLHPHCTQILPELIVGEYPRPEDAFWLRAQMGVQAVLSLQDDGDLAAKGLSWPALVRAYEEVGILAGRIGIADGNPEALFLELDRAVAWLAEQIDAGRRVYLHCNAGVNRAPTVAIAYLHAVRGLPLGAARRLVTSLRTCVPFVSVLERRYGAASGNK
jgi:protein-tyrosine phosphatase